MTPQQRFQVLSERAHRRGWNAVVLRTGQYALVKQDDGRIHKLAEGSDLSMLLLDIPQLDAADKVASALMERMTGGQR